MRAADLRITGRGAWFLGRRFACAVGRGGVGDKRGEGDGVTPHGVFAIEGVLWRADRGLRPRCGGLRARPIGPRDGWSDDPRDPDYNRAVLRPRSFRSEALRRPDPLYDLVAVLDYNRRPVTKGRGSAIFLHVWRGPRRPTEGCVALAAADLRWILARWTQRSRVIVGQASTRRPAPPARARS